MLLEDLFKRTSYNVILVRSNSTLLIDFIESTLKRQYKNTVGSDSILEVTKVSDKKELKEIAGLYPMLSDRWLVKINLDKLIDTKKDYKKDRDMQAFIWQLRNAPTCVFYCTCSNYGVYRVFYDLLKDYQGLAAFYFTYLKRYDMRFIYNNIVVAKKGTELTTPLMQYLNTAYAGDIDKVMQLFELLSKGVKCESKQDILNLIGIGNLTADSFVLGLLKPITGSDKGLKTVMKNRMQEAVDLGTNMGYLKLQHYMLTCLESLTQIKMLLLNGTVYKQLDNNNLSERYKNLNLKRYSNYIEKLKELGLTDLLLLYKVLGETKWYSALEVQSFIYSYYNIKAQQVVINPSKKKVSTYRRVK